MLKETNQINPTAERYIDHIAVVSKEKRPLVAIHCITYNHEPYIRDALDGFVMQKTDFPFVAIVHDDASTDGTSDIIREYAERYPGIILPIYERENQYSKRDGSLIGIMNIACQTTGAKYIAMCEGDDYWTDPLKLQKQVKFLELQPEIVYTCHLYDTLTNDNKIIPCQKWDNNLYQDYYVFNREYVLNHWISKTLTSLFRVSALPDKKTLSKYLYSRDVHLVYHILSSGDGALLNFNGGVYRDSGTGVFSSLDKLSKIKLACNIWKEFYAIEKNADLKHVYEKTFQAYFIQMLKKKKIIFPTSIMEVLSILKLPGVVIDKLKNG